MSEYKEVNTFLHDATAISRVASVSFDPVVAQLASIPDGSGDVTFYTVKSAPVRGVVVVLDKTEAEKMANDPDPTNAMSFKVKTEADVDKTVSFTGVVTGAAKGTNYNLGGSGPWSIEFGAATASEPV
ncbi:MAG: hypothetical protein GY788_32365 [bacterium]|nr:hypothetical protein [bacterium]